MSVGLKNKEKKNLSLYSYNLGAEGILARTGSKQRAVLEGQSDVSLLVVTSCLFLSDGVNDQSPRQRDSECAESGGVSA